jgi:hypothetical protein
MFQHPARSFMGGMERIAGRLAKFNTGGTARGRKIPTYHETGE